MTISATRPQSDPAGAEGSDRRDRVGRLLAPRSVALVGASDRNGWSVFIHTALGAYGFAGDVFYVNPRGGTAHGQPLATTLGELPIVPDLVYLMVPAVAVPGVLEEAAALGVPAAEVLSSGFAEVGEEGRALQDRVAAIAAASGMAVLGPNNLGFVNPRIGAGLSPMAPGDAPLKPGRVAMISQSGNLAAQIQTLARSFDVGLSLVVSTGNEVDVTAGDVIDVLADDTDTDAIGVFVETIRRPDDFRAAALRARRAGKLVVVLKTGRSEASARSAMAHTGSLVGDDAIIDAALASAGVLRVDTLEDLLATADVFTRIGAPTGRRVGVVSISGGAGDIASDLAAEAGLELPDVCDSTKAVLADVLPDYGTAQNPLDMTGLVVGKPEIFGQGLAALGADPGLDIVLAITEAEHSQAGTADMLSGLLEAAAATPVPALLVTTTVHAISEALLAERAASDRPAVSWGVERVIDAIGGLARWSDLSLQAEGAATLDVRIDDLGPTTGTWSEGRSRTLLERAGVPVVPGGIARSANEAVALAHGFDGPVALKVVSDDIAHKSDVGGVALGVAVSDAGARYDAVLDRVAAAAPDALVDGVLVSPMRAGGVELLVGVVRDEQWGAVLAIAMGGIWTEVLHDVQRIALPALADAIERAILRLRSVALLQGARGTKPADIPTIAAVAARIGDLAAQLGPDLRALEVNPLRVDGDVVEALDAMVEWRS